jgi:hypothetical protein
MQNAVVDALSQALQYSTLGLPRRCTNSLLLKKDETLRETQTVGDTDSSHLRLSGISCNYPL